MIDLPGSASEAGYAHGTLLREQLSPAFLERYLRPFHALKRVTPDDLRTQSLAWLERLPVHYQDEIEAMAAGAGVPLDAVTRYLYSDIARPSESAVDDSNPAALVSDGPMCTGIASAVEAESGAGVEAGAEHWAARNCDWYPPLLARGCAAVVHRPPNRIPSMALGIFGDIDCDTGVNAEGLWLHLHTMWAADQPHPSRSMISWLFWCREALETCATIDEVERFVESTSRDRGVVLFALDGKTGEKAVFECTRSGHERLGPQDAERSVLFATNHCRAKHPTDPARFERSRAGSTTRRYEAVRTELLESGPPEHGPDDFIDLLAHPEVEMRGLPTLATIYAAVCAPAKREVWFAQGTPDGSPASSSDTWCRVAWPFT